MNEDAGVVIFRLFKGATDLVSWIGGHTPIALFMQSHVSEGFRVEILDYHPVTSRDHVYACIEQWQRHLFPHRGRE